MSAGDFECPNCSLGTIYMKGDSAGQCLHCGWSIWNDDDPGAYPDLEDEVYYDNPCLDCGPWCMHWSYHGCLRIIRPWAWRWIRYCDHVPARRMKRFLRKQHPHRKRGHHRRLPTVVLVACTKAKVDVPMKAKYLYLSTWFRYTSRYAEQIGDRWFVLSAKYGLLGPDLVIYPYDLSLNDMPYRERQDWAREVLAAIERTTGFKCRFVVLAGKRYRQYLVESLRLAGAIVEVPMAGLGIGQQVAWLKKQF